jgi:hypothetical protein
LREFRARTLTFRCNEVHLLLAQATGQVGHLSEVGEWSWHGDLADPLFCDALLGEIEDLTLSVEANWLEGVTMASVSFLISRLLASNQDAGVRARAHGLLREVRKKTFSWVQELSLKVREVEDEEIRGRLRDIAAICRSTFDVDRGNMREQLSCQEDVEILVSCAIFIHDSTPAVLTGIPEESRLLHERDRRLSMVSEEILADRIEESNEGINSAIRGSGMPISQGRSGGGWTIRVPAGLHARLRGRRVDGRRKYTSICLTVRYSWKANHWVPCLASSLAIPSTN